MVQISEQLTALTKSQLQASLRLAEVTGDNLEKLAGVHFSSARDVYKDSVRALRQVASLRDAGEIAAFTAGAAQPIWDKTMAYARSVYAIGSAAQAQFAAVVEQRVTDFNKDMVLTLDAIMRSAPAGSEGAMTGIKSAIHSANTAYETMVKAARRMMSVAEDNLAAVAGQAAPAKKRAA
jgi:phasin family protein